MKIKCAKLKEILSLEAQFIRQYGKQQLLEDYNTAQRNRSPHVKLKHLH